MGGKLSHQGVQLTGTKHQLADLQTAKSRYQLGKQVLEGIEGTWKQQLLIESLASQPDGPSKEGPADILLYTEDNIYIYTYIKAYISAGPSLEGPSGCEGRIPITNCCFQVPLIPLITCLLIWYLL